MRGRLRAKGEHTTIEALVDIVQQTPAKHVVITGGEPMLQANIVPLTLALSAVGYHITIETAGTVFRPVAVDLFSISPKLADSTPSAPVKLAERHERIRLSLPILRQLLDHAAHQFKFVIATQADIDEVQTLLADLGAVDPSRVLLMPEGRTVAEIDAHLPLLIEACKANGWHLCDRLHLRLFGNTPGT